jgi:UDP-glucuronate 4-epimerase
MRPGLPPPCPPAPHVTLLPLVPSYCSSILNSILVTGAAGFVGFHVAHRLLEQGHRVVGLDNLTDYYSVDLKRQRVAELAKLPGFEFAHVDVADRHALEQICQRQPLTRCVHLAAQPGVRYSLENPAAYVDSNLVGFGNILEAARHGRWQHLVYASSSSVYGANTKVPFAVDDRVDHPINLYAATKKANELMAHAYAHLFRLPTTGLRFFTVYGPWGRPDMAVWKFTEAIDAGRPIDVYNQGRMERDFTYIDDIVAGVLAVLESPPTASEGHDSVPYRLYNIGNHQPEKLETLIAAIESALGKKAERRMLPMQPGDMLRTYADIDSLRDEHGFEPTTPLRDGVQRFVDWYREWKSTSTAFQS